MSVRSTELMVPGVPPVLDVATSQRLHQRDPEMLAAPRLEVRDRLEALNMAGEFGAAEAYLTEMAARRAYSEHRARPGVFTRILDRVLG